jgi:hypothetical protein
VSDILHHDRLLFRQSEAPCYRDHSLTRQCCAWVRIFPFVTVIERQILASCERFSDLKKNAFNPLSQPRSVRALFTPTAVPATEWLR